jgi:hypothetical protein
MSGRRELSGTFELHIFVEPLDPDAAQAERFTQACRAAPTPMKGLLLRLDYVGRGFVGVLQSSRYVNGTLDDARRGAAADAAVLRAAGFSVIREKIEALVENAGVPRNAHDDGAADPDRYFEFHLLVDRDQAPLSEDDMVALRGLSREYTARLQSPVPLSYNALKPGQRFLNLRARGVGIEEALRPVRELSARIEAQGLLHVRKVISEYVCFDTNRAVDNGWLEPA